MFAITGPTLVRTLSGSHQRRLAEQLAASDQVSDGDVEVRVAAAPVGDLGEGVSGEDVLQRRHRSRNQRLKGQSCQNTVDINENRRLTLVFGSIRLTPCLLIAIRRVSG